MFHFRRIPGIGARRPGRILSTSPHLNTRREADLNGILRKRDSRKQSSLPVVKTSRGCVPHKRNMLIAHYFFWRFSRVLLLAHGLPTTTARKMQNLGGGIHSGPSTSPTMSNPDWAKLISFCVHQMLTPSTKTLMERIPRVFSAKTFPKIPEEQRAT